jgi:carbamoyl-phosphate synthase small subunit
MAGMDLARVVTQPMPRAWTETEWVLGSGYGAQTEPRFHVVAYDFGVKHNILRMLASRGCQVTVVPAQTPAAEVLRLRPDGVFLSNGPGDPEPCDYAIAGDPN